MIIYLYLIFNWKFRADWENDIKCNLSGLFYTLVKDKQICKKVNDAGLKFY